METTPLRRARVTVLVDNTASGIDGLLSEHGLALLIEAQGGDGEERIILLDTGQTGKPLLHNMEALGVDPREIDLLVLSHRHVDHTGGIRALLEARRGKPLQILAHPSVFDPAYARLGGLIAEIGMPFTRCAAQSLGARFILASKPLEAAPGIVFSGEVPQRWGPRHTWRVYRQSPSGGLEEDPVPDDAYLALVFENETYVLTGCGHAGVENILGHAAETTGKRVAGLIGGLHLQGAPRSREEEVAAALAAAKPKLVAALHCTGPLAQRLLRDKLGEAHRLMGTGSRTTLPT